MTTINEFLATIGRGGFVNPNRFIVRISFPQQSRNIKGIKDYFTQYGISPHDAFRVNMYCETTEIPGKTLATSEIKHYGPIFKMPYAVIYEDINMTFRVGSDMKEKKFFDAWQNMIIDPVTNNINYFKEYVSSIELFQLDQNDKFVYGMKLIDSYPITMSPMAFDHNSRDEIQKLSIRFTFRKWEPLPVPNFTSQGVTEDRTNVGLQILINQARQTLSQNRPSIADLF